MLDPKSFDAIYEQEELEEIFRLNLKMEFAVTETEVHQADIAAGAIPMTEELLSSLTQKTVDRAKLTGTFSELYPMVRTYVSQKCFGQIVDINNERIRSHLNRLEIQEGIAKYLARKVSELTIERKTIEFENGDFELSGTIPFSVAFQILPDKKVLEVKRWI